MFDDIILPDEIIVKIAQFLKGKDLLHFTWSCRTFYFKFDEETFWKRRLRIERFEVDKPILRYAKEVSVNNCALQCLPKFKLLFLMCLKIRRKWGNSVLEPPRTEIHHGGTAVGTPSLRRHYDHVHDMYQNGYLCKTVNSRSITSVKNLFSQSNWKDCTSSNGMVRTMKLAVVLDDYLVTSYRDTCTSIIEVFSLSSCKLLWMKSNAEINVDNVMRQTDHDVVPINNSIVVYRFESVTVHTVNNKEIEESKVLPQLEGDHQSGLFQYPKFSSSSKKYLILPYQMSFNRIDDWTLQVYCYEFSKETRLLETNLRYNHTAKIEVTEVHHDDCYGLLKDPDSHLILLQWDIKKQQLVRRIEFQSVPRQTSLLNGLNLSLHLRLVQWNGVVYNLSGNIVGQLRGCEEDVVRRRGTVTSYFVGDKLLAFSQTEVLMANLSELSSSQTKILDLNKLNINFDSKLSKVVAVNQCYIVLFNPKENRNDVIYFV